MQMSVASCLQTLVEERNEVVHHDKIILGPRPEQSSDQNDGYEKSVQDKSDRDRPFSRSELMDIITI